MKIKKLIKGFKDKEKEILNAIMWSMLIFLIVGLVFSIDSFKIGEHNSDLGQNIRYLNCKYNLSLMDIASDFEYYSGEELYIKGNNNIRINYYLSMAIAFMIGLFISDLISSSKKTNRSGE